MSGYWPEGDLGDDCDGDIDGYDGPISVPVASANTPDIAALARDSDIIWAVQQLQKYGIDGAAYEKLIRLT